MKILSLESELLRDIPKEILKLAPKVPLIDIADHQSSNKSEDKIGEAIFVAKELEPLAVIEYLLNNNILSLLQINPKYFHEDLITFARLKEKPEIYFKDLSDQIFSKAEEHLILEFNSVTQKEDLRKKILEFAAKIKSTNVLDSVQAVFEELYMNAIIDAPREYLKKNPTDRPYENGKTAKFCLVRSELQIAVSCSDPYGSLDCKKFLGRLREIYQSGAGKVINLKNEGGAGIGCSLMLENSSSIILGVRPQQQTVVTCIIPIGLSNRQRSEVKKSLHLVQL